MIKAREFYCHELDFNKLNDFPYARVTIHKTKQQEDIVLFREVLPPTADVEERFLKIIKDWKHKWMNQTQNSKQDFENYHRRAFGIDANMVHSLAKDLVASRNAEELICPSCGIERYRKDIKTCSDQIRVNLAAKGEEITRLKDALSHAKMVISKCKDDYWFMTNLIEKYGTDKDQVLKDCAYRMKFREPIFQVITAIDKALEGK